MNMKEPMFIGVDVGSYSVRAALVDKNGSVHSTQTVDITVHNPKTDFYEQDSEEIWRAICVAVKEVTKNVEDKQIIQGLGFDGTCSLVILGENFDQVTVSPSTGKSNFNIIMWMDHRAHEEAEAISATKHRLLDYVGGKLSLEMEMAKLLWLKKNMKNTWNKAVHFFDLPDFLTFKATGQLIRSLGPVVCKWNYSCDGDSTNHGWDQGFLEAIGLGELKESNYKRIGEKVLLPGSCCGHLTEKAAEELGLNPATAVASSLIDAHAGGLALVAAQAKPEDDLTGKLGLVCGTSTCHMIASSEKFFVPGVWGPTYSSMVPGKWQNEGGQSATGALVDHIIQSHPASAAFSKDTNIYIQLEDKLRSLAKEEGLQDISLLTKDIHVYPDFHGNRSPLSDSTMRGMISGLTLDTSEKSLALLYLATIQALTYGTKHIIEQLSQCGHHIASVLMCGGLSKSPLFIQVHADALGVPVLIPSTKESVLLGSAMLGAAASGVFPDLRTAAIAMGGDAETYSPRQDLYSFHMKKYRVFREMQKNQLEYRAIMA